MEITTQKINQIVLRRATVADKERIMRISSDHYEGLDYLHEEIDNQLNRTDRLPYVAELDGKLISYLAFRVCDLGTSLHYVSARTSEKYRGKAIQKRLLEFATRDARWHHLAVTKRIQVVAHSPYLDTQFAREHGEEVLVVRNTVHLRFKKIDVKTRIEHLKKHSRFEQFLSRIKTVDNRKEAEQTILDPNVKQRFFPNNVIVSGYVSYTLTSECLQDAKPSFLDVGGITLYRDEHSDVTSLCVCVKRNLITGDGFIFDLDIYADDAFVAFVYLIDRISRLVDVLSDQSTMAFLIQLSDEQPIRAEFIELTKTYLLLDPTPFPSPLIVLQHQYPSMLA